MINLRISFSLKNSKSFLEYFGSHQFSSPSNAAWPRKANLGVNLPRGSQKARPLTKNSHLTSVHVLMQCLSSSIRLYLKTICTNIQTCMQPDFLTLTSTVWKDHFSSLLKSQKKDFQPARQAPSQ